MYLAGFGDDAWYEITDPVTEPFSSYPTNGLAEAVANGTALSLAGHACRTLRLEVGVLEAGVEEV